MPVNSEIPPGMTLDAPGGRYGGESACAQAAGLIATTTATTSTAGSTGPGILLGAIVGRRIVPAQES
jgi:hypothetical protein